MYTPDGQTELPESADIQFEGPAPYLPATAWLPGWPGCRTRPGRSGYDPLDQDFELAHMQGVMLRVLFAGRLRTRNLVYLVLLTIVGLVFCLPLVFILGTALTEWIGALLTLLIFSPSIALGLAIWVNVYFSMFFEETDPNQDYLVI